MAKKRFIILGLAMCLFYPIFAFAETIITKSDKAVEGNLIERTDKYIRIDFKGVPLTYWLDEIESIDGEKVNSTSKLIASPSSGFIYKIRLNKKDVTVYLGKEYMPKDAPIHILGLNQEDKIYLNEKEAVDLRIGLKQLQPSSQKNVPHSWQLIMEKAIKLSDKEWIDSKLIEALYHEEVHLNQQCLLDSPHEFDQLVKRFPQSLSYDLETKWKIITETGAYLGALFISRYPKDLFVGIQGYCNSDTYSNAVLKVVYSSASKAAQEILYKELGVSSDLLISQGDVFYQIPDLIIGYLDDQIRNAARQGYEKTFGISLPPSENANIATNLLSKLNFDSVGNLISSN